MSLVYGCVYILRFRTMKDMYKAAKWADVRRHNESLLSVTHIRVQEAQRDTSILWNVWVLLAMPVVWLAWSLILFCICMIDFVWEQPFTSPSTDNSAPTFQSSNALAVSLSRSDRIALAPRIIISLVFLLGLAYFVLVLRTFWRWSDKRVEKYVTETGRPLSPPARGAPLPQRPSLESRLSRRKDLEIGDDDKMGTEENHTERRAHSVDSAVV